MAHHKSAKKRNRQNQVRYERNKANRTHVKTATKKVLALVEEGDKAGAERQLQEATKTIYKVASKGIIHKRTAGRKVSGLARRVHELSAAS